MRPRVVCRILVLAILSPQPRRAQLQLPHPNHLVTTAALGTWFEFHRTPRYNYYTDIIIVA